MCQRCARLPWVRAIAQGKADHFLYRIAKQMRWPGYSDAISLPRPNMQVNRILFPVDFSGRARATAPFVHSMAQRYGAAVTLLHVIPPLPPLYFEVAYPEESSTQDTAQTLLND